MERERPVTGSDLFIVDNSDQDWKVLRYLREWCGLAKSTDIASGYFEIGALLGLDGSWQQVDQFRILMGDEVSKRTNRAFEAGVERVLTRLDASLEAEKDKNDFLNGVPAIVDALNSRKINCRVYRKDKFHAKAYITQARQEVLGSFALVGSSNFTYPGLTANVELNVQLAGRQVNALQEWYEKHWQAGEDVTPDVLRTIERHVRIFEPFEVYAKSLQEFFRHQRDEPDHWERNDSAVYPELDQYQRDGYHNLIDIANVYNGAFLCDSVGLGKTFIGMMLIERLIMHENRNVLLLVPKAGLDAVWRSALRRFLPKLRRGAFGGLEILTHTDLSSENDGIRERLDAAKERAHVVIVDEAHHFRNPGTRGALLAELQEGPQRGGRLIVGEGRVRPSRYWRLFELIGEKRAFLLTATPLNNTLHDLRHMIELFSRRRDDYFALKPVGVRNLRSYIVQLEKKLESIARSRGKGSVEVETNAEQALDVLADDALFASLVVQRSRGYVKEHQKIHGGREVIFPVRENPNVAEYELRSTYGNLLKMVERAFHRVTPLFSLAPYNPAGYSLVQPAEDDFEAKFIAGRQAQVVGLVRTSFLKRFESSVQAFSASCSRLLVKLLAFVVKHVESSSERRALASWKGRHDVLVEELQANYPELFASGDATLFDDLEPDDDEDMLLAKNVLDDVELLPRDQFRVGDMLLETFEDLQILGDFLDELRKFKPAQDFKLKRLLELLGNDPVLKHDKVMIFTEFADTAEYLYDQLTEAGIGELLAIDGSASAQGRVDVIRRFAPYYNGLSSGALERDGAKEIRILISTDVLSEGLNLQDATRLINYDLHWNPVRLMQRIGRVDRRLNSQIEAAIVAAHPERKSVRGTVAYWNFLPPDELNLLLTLYSRVTHKTLRISRTFGIEGGKLLTPADEYEALREFNAAYERKTRVEELSLEYERLLKENPQLAAQLRQFPKKVFSGKQHPKAGSRAVFFCFALPARLAAATPAIGAEQRPSLFADENGGARAVANNSAPLGGEVDGWSIEGGPVRWYLYDIESNQIIEEDAPGIADVIRCAPETPRYCTIDQASLSEIRATVEKHIKNTYLKQVQAPLGVKPVLRAWLELS